MIEFERLRTLIGRTVWHANTCCEVVEVLEDGMQIVLHCQGGGGIQTNQFGEARRRVPDMVTINVFSGAEFSPAFSALLLAP